MTKRIIYGVFLLIALGALGLILAGALTSGEQLIVRFLTAIIVAALGLYVISDLRLQADDHAVATKARATTRSRRALNSDQPPPDSTAAFMATVTGKRSAQPVDPASFDAATVGDGGLTNTVHDTADRIPVPALAGTGEPDLRTGIADVVADSEPTVELVAPGRPGISQGAETAPASSSPSLGSGIPTPTGDQSTAASPATTEALGSVAVSSSWDPPAVAEPDGSPYQADLDEAELWPFNASPETVVATTDNAEDEVDGLVAIFARKTEQELSQRQAADTELEGVDGAITEDNGEMVPEVREGAPGAALLEGVGDFLNRGPALEARDETDPVEASIDSDEEQPEPTSGEIVSSRHLPNEATTVGDHTTSYSDETTDRISTTTNGEKVSYEPPTGLTPTDTTALVPQADERIAPIIDLRTAQLAAQATTNEPAGRTTSTAEDLEAAIQSGEFEVISSLIQQRLLSSEGPISDRDVSTMVYVAFTSNELRKILLAGGTLDGDLSQLDLGDVEVFVDPTDEELETLQESAAMIDLRTADLVTVDSQAL